MARRYIARAFVDLDDATKGGADFSRVRVAGDHPACVEHGAMNKVSDDRRGAGVWRCIATSGAKWNPCRAAAREIEEIDLTAEMHEQASDDAYEDWPVDDDTEDVDVKGGLL